MIVVSMTTAEGFLSICQFASTARTSGRGNELILEKRERAGLHTRLSPKKNAAPYQASFIPN